MPGTHSSGIAEDGENIPEWVTIFQQFWEYKKNLPSKTAQEEQRREEHRTMLRSILTPNQPLGIIQSNQPRNETSTRETSQPSSNSLVAQGSSIVVAPVCHSTATTTRKRNARRVSTDISPRNNGHGSLGNSSARADISQLMDAFNQSNNALFRRSVREVLQDHDDVMDRLAAARATNNND